MEIIALNKLFTTKEDRRAVYKAIVYGSNHATKLSFIHNMVRGCVHDAEALQKSPIVYTGGVVEEDVAEKLSRESGVSLLSVKQVTLSARIVREGVHISAGEKTPWECTTIDEINELEEHLFGIKKQGGYEYTCEHLEQLNRLQGDSLYRIQNQLVYKEMLPVDLTNTPEESCGRDYILKRFSTCVEIACFMAGYFYWDIYDNKITKTIDLKAYLNGTEFTTEFERLACRRIEVLFALSLYLERCKMWFNSGAPWASYIHTNSDTIGMFEDCVVLYTHIQQKRDVYRSLLNELLKIRHGVYKTTDEEDVTKAQEEADKSMCLIDNYYLPYVFNEPWESKVGDTRGLVPMRYRWTEARRLEYIRSGNIPHSNEDKMDSFIHMSTTGLCTCDVGLIKYFMDTYLGDVEDIPNVVVRNTVKYLGAMYSYCYDVESMHDKSVEASVRLQRIKDYSVVVMEDVCISALRRTGVDLHILFVGDGAEHSLTLYVDCEEDKKYVEEQAHLAGIELPNVNNSVVVLTRAAVSDLKTYTMTETEFIDDCYRGGLFMVGAFDRQSIKNSYELHEGDRILFTKCGEVIRVPEIARDAFLHFLCGFSFDIMVDCNWDLDDRITTDIRSYDDAGTWGLYDKIRERLGDKTGLVVLHFSHISSLPIPTFELFYYLDKTRAIPVRWCDLPKYVGEDYISSWERINALDSVSVRHLWEVTGGMCFTE